MNSRHNKLLNMVKKAKRTVSARTAKIMSLNKMAVADQHGVFQNFQTNVTEYATRERYLSMRGNESGTSRDNLYGIGPEHEDSYVPTEYVAPSLSTRYSPDRVGVQAQRVSDGVYKDPYTNKIYDYNEGFTAESGETYPGGSPALQSSLMNLANHLDRKGLIKEADYLDRILKSSAMSWAAAFSRFQGDLEEHEEGRERSRATREQLEEMLKILLPQEQAELMLLMAQGGAHHTSLESVPQEGELSSSAEDHLDETVGALLKIAAGLDAKGDASAVKLVENMISGMRKVADDACGEGREWNAITSRCEKSKETATDTGGTPTTSGGNVSCFRSASQVPEGTEPVRGENWDPSGRCSPGEQK